MPRDANGNYTLPAGNPVQSGTIITSNWANTTLPDLGAEVQDSLNRSGKGGMLDQLKLVDGTISAPGASFLNELTSGLYRAGVGDLRLTVQGQDAAYFAANRTNGIWVGKGGDLAAVVAAIGSDEVTLFLYPEPWSISADLVIPRNIVVVAPFGVTITVPAVNSLTLNQSEPLAGRYKVFETTGAFSFPYSVVYPEWWGADPTKTDDSSLAFLIAIVSVGDNGLVDVGVGNFLFTQPNYINITRNRVHMWGKGPYATRFTFNPSGPGNFITLRIAGSTINQCSIRHMTLFSEDTTHAKTAIYGEDLSGCVLDDIVVGGTRVATGGAHWGDDGNASIAFHMAGRDNNYFHDLQLNANQAIRFSKNPNTGIQISGDHITFHNLIASGNGAPVIQVTDNDGCVFTEMHFTGSQGWVRGNGGFRWVDNTTPGSSHGWNFEGVRYERNDDPDNSPFMNIAAASGLQQLQVNGGQCGGSRGLLLRNITQMAIRSFSYTDNAREALNVDATVKEVLLESCFWQTGSSAEYSALQLYSRGPQVTSGPLPTNGYLVEPRAGSYDELLEGTLAGAQITLAPSGFTPIGGASQTGFIFITGQNNASGMFMLEGANAVVGEVQDPRNSFSTVKDTADQFNVYWDTGTSRYVVQNGYSINRWVYIFRSGRGQ